MHGNVLTQQAARLIDKFHSFRSFYLMCGTALALHIGHRISVDFDFFSNEKLPPNLLQKVKRIFSDQSIEVTYQSVDQINLLLGGVKTTFFYYPYPVMEPFAKFRGISLSSILEIAAMKAYAIGKRLAYKDYVDWYFLLSENRVILPHVIDLAQRKFQGDFNDRLFLGQLASLEDVPDQNIVFLNKEVGRQSIEEFLREKIKEVV